MIRLALGLRAALENFFWGRGTGICPYGNRPRKRESADSTANVFGLPGRDEHHVEMFLSFKSGRVDHRPPSYGDFFSESMTRISSYSPPC